MRRLLIAGLIIIFISPGCLATTVGIDRVTGIFPEKAGTILSVSHVTNKPIYFLGTGQEYQDLTNFTKENILKNLGLEN